MKTQNLTESRLILAFREKRNVMSAVILRDMRTRFFNHGIGFLVQSLWPLAHMIAILAINTFAGRRAPFGESATLFFATGIIPTLSFIYISRFMSLSLILNRPMLDFPVVRVADILIARAFLEIIASVLTLVFIMTILWLIGEDPFPNDPTQAICAYLATLLLAVGVGSLAGVIVMFFPIFVTIYALMGIVFYVSSGALFVASALPDQLAIPLSWNPLVQAVEWMRTAYYESYSDRLISKEYLISFGLTSLCIGLLLERVLRRRMIEG